MKLNNINKDNYEEFINYLFSLQDIKYKEFHSKIVDSNIIGIRTFELKNIAKEIAKGNYQSFINANKHIYYDETIIHGLIIGYLKDFNEVKEQLDIFIPFIDNWATNDIVCANLKIFKKNKEEGFKYICKYLNSDKPFYIRFALVMLLDHYIDDQYIDIIFKIISSIKSENYYVKMANAWLISICYIKYSNKCYNFLLNSNLDKFTYNKAIDKICDSYRVSDEDKLLLKQAKK